MSTGYEVVPCHERDQVRVTCIHGNACTRHEVTTCDPTLISMEEVAALACLGDKESWVDSINVWRRAKVMTVRFMIN